MDAVLLFVLDSDVHVRLEWEIAIFSAAMAVGVPLVAGFISLLWRRGSSNRRVIRRTAQEMAQVRDFAVDKCRDGKPFPRLPTLPEDLDRKFEDEG
jgi:Flp pilus assembly protein TadB